jgi:hypothetical protein
MVRILLLKLCCLVSQVRQDLLYSSILSNWTLELTTPLSTLFPFFLCLHFRLVGKIRTRREQLIIQHPDVQISVFESLALPRRRPVRALHWRVFCCWPRGELLMFFVVSGIPIFVVLGDWRRSIYILISPNLRFSYSQWRFHIPIQYLGVCKSYSCQRNTSWFRTRQPNNFHPGAVTVLALRCAVSLHRLCRSNGFFLLQRIKRLDM